ncbi:MAG: VOC family protein [Thermomicrobiales bacterium]
MIRQLDHIVILVPALESAIPDAIAAGFTVVRGGQHATGGTENALIAFADGTYVELIAFVDPSRPSTNPWYERLTLGGGLVDYALLSDHVEADISRIRNAGVTMDDAWNLGRRRTDGERTEWTLAMAGHDGLPFLIQDLTPRTLRVPHDPSEIDHPNGARSVSGVVVLVPDLAAVLDAFATMTGASGEPVKFSLPGIARAATFAVGQDARQWICVAEPSPHADDDPAEAAITAHELATYGPGPFAITLSTAAGAEPAPPGAGTLLDPARLGSARIFLA